MDITDAIASNVKQEFAAKEKAKKAARSAAKSTKKAAMQTGLGGRRIAALLFCCPKNHAGRTHADFSLQPSSKLSFSFKWIVAAFVAGNEGFVA